MAVFAYALAFLSTGISALLFIRIRSLTSLVLWIPKALAGSTAAFAAVMGVPGAAFGLLSRARLAMVAGGLGALLSARYVLRATGRQGRHQVG